MRKLILLSIMLAAQGAFADRITFSGVVTTERLWGDYFNNPNVQAADVGSPVTGFIRFDPYTFHGFILVKEASLTFPGGPVVSQGGGSLAQIPGGYFFSDDSASGFLGFDNAFSFTVLDNGSGTFWGNGSFFEDAGNPDPTTDFDQFYSGNIVSATFSRTVPDTGTSAGLLGLALVGLAAGQRAKSAADRRRAKEALLP